MTTKSTTYGFDKVLSKLKARAEMLEDDVVETLSRVGEDAINTARATGNYTDRTGNLRNSIGYQVLAKGQPEATKTTEGQTAPSKGYTANPDKVSSEIEKAIEEYSRNAEPDKYSLVVVAGMEYGLYLEKNKGYNVLNTAKILAEQDLGKQMAILKKEFIEDFNTITGK